MIVNTKPHPGLNLIVLPQLIYAALTFISLPLVISELCGK
jgi:hypothetical protein